MKFFNTNGKVEKETADCARELSTKLSRLKINWRLPNAFTDTVEPRYFELD